MFCKHSEFNGGIELNSEYLIHQAKNLLPRNLDDIVRKNRELLRLEYANSHDIARLNKVIVSKTYKGILIDAFLYKRLTSLSPLEPICAVGYMLIDSEKIPYHTSQLIGMDIDQKIIETTSGSIYKIESFSDTQRTDTNLLLHICHMSHRDGWGSHFGTAEIYY